MEGKGQSSKEREDREEGRERGREREREREREGGRETLILTLFSADGALKI